MSELNTEDQLLDHNYDGIKELDNRLPPWWVYLFYVTIVFGVVYLARFHEQPRDEAVVQKVEDVVESQASVAHRGGSLDEGSGKAVHRCRDRARGTTLLDGQGASHGRLDKPDRVVLGQAPHGDRCQIGPRRVGHPRHHEQG